MFGDSKQRIKVEVEDYNNKLLEITQFRDNASLCLKDSKKTYTELCSTFDTLLEEIFDDSIKLFFSDRYMEIVKNLDQKIKSLDSVDVIPYLPEFLPDFFDFPKDHKENIKLQKTILEKINCHKTKFEKRKGHTLDYIDDITKHRSIYNKTNCTLKDLIDEIRIKINECKKICDETKQAFENTREKYYEEISFTSTKTPSNDALFSEYKSTETKVMELVKKCEERSKKECGFVLTDVETALKVLEKQRDKTEASVKCFPRAIIFDSDIFPFIWEEENEKYYTVNDINENGNFVLNKMDELLSEIKVRHSNCTTLIGYMKSLLECAEKTYRIVLQIISKQCEEIDKRKNELSTERTLLEIRIKENISKARTNLDEVDNFKKIIGTKLAETKSKKKYPFIDADLLSVCEKLEEQIQSVFADTITKNDLKKVKEPEKFTWDVFPKPPYTLNDVEDESQRVFDSCNNSIKLSEEILVKSQEWCKKAKAFKLQFEKAVDAFVVDTNKKIEREKKLNSKISKKNNEFKTLTETYIQTYNNAKTLLENCLSQLVSINVGDCRRLERTDIYEDYQTKFNGIKDQLAEIQNAAIEMESLHKMLQDHSGLDDLENYLNQLTNSCDSIIQLTEKAKRIINECEIIYPTLVKFIDNETTMLNAERKIKLTLLDSMGNKIATMSCGDYRKIEPNDDKGWVRAMPKAILMLDEIKKYDLGIGYGIVGEYNTTDEAFCEDMTGVRFFLGSEPYVTANKPFTIKVKYKETEYLPFDPYKFEFLTEIVQYTITTAENKIVNFTLLKEH